MALSKHDKTEHNRFNRVLSRFKDLYSRARIFKLTHDRILEVRREIFASSDYQKLSREYKGWIGGWESATMDRIWHEELEFCYVFGDEVVSAYHMTREQHHQAPNRPCGYRWRGTKDSWFTEPKTLTQKMEEHHAKERS